MTHLPCSRGAQAYVSIINCCCPDPSVFTGKKLLFRGICCAHRCKLSHGSSSCAAQALHDVKLHYCRVKLYRIGLWDLARCWWRRWRNNESKSYDLMASCCVCVTLVFFCKTDVLNCNHVMWSIMHCFSLTFLCRLSQSLHCRWAQINWLCWRAVKHQSTEIISCTSLPGQRPVTIPVYN